MIGSRALLLMNEIDEVLEMVEAGLMRGQPPYSGKMGIKFIYEGNADGRLTPVVRKLLITKSGNYWPIRVKNTNLRRRAAWKSSFAINHRFVKELLGEAEYLIKTRKDGNISIRQAKHWETLFCRAREMKLKQCIEKIRYPYKDVNTDLNEVNLDNSYSLSKHINSNNNIIKGALGERASFLVREIDAALNIIAGYLRKSQPVMSGQISINYINDGAEFLTPIVQKLQITKTGKFIPLKVPSTGLAKRAAKRGEFLERHEYVKLLLSEAEFLIKTRKETNVKIRQIKHWENLFCEAHKKKVKESFERTKQLQLEIELNLRKRKPRSVKNEERQRMGIETVAMSNKHWMKTQGRRKMANVRPKTVLPGSEFK